MFSHMLFPHTAPWGLRGYPWGLPATVSPFNPLMNLNCSKRQMDCKRSKHVVVLLGGNKRSHCTAPLSSSGALVESLFSSSLNRSWIEAGMRIGSAISPSPDSPLWMHWGCMRSYSPTTTWALSLIYQSIETHLSKVNFMAIWEGWLWWKKAGRCRVRTRDHTDAAAWPAANSSF